MEKKKPWLEFEAQRKAALAIKEKYEIAQAKFDEAAKTIEPLLVEQKAQQEEVDQLSGAVDEKVTVMKKNDSAHRQCQEQIQKCDTETASLEQELTALNNREKDRDSTLRLLKEHLESLKTEYEQLPDLNEMKPKLDEALHKNRALMQDLSELKAQELEIGDKLQRCTITQQQTQKKLSELDDAKKQKLRKLEQEDRNSYTAFTWLQSNQGKFKRPITGPLFLECNVSNREYAAFLEMSAPNWLLKAFVAEDRQDQELFLKLMHDDQHLNISVVCVDMAREVQPRIEINSLKKYGVSCWLSDVVQAPPAIIQALSVFAQLQNTAIGTEQVQQYIDSLPAGLMVYTPTKQILRNQSKWENRLVSTRILNLKMASFLTPADLALANQLRSELQNVTLQQKSLSEDLRQLREAAKKKAQDQEEIKALRDSFTTAKKKAETLAKRIDQKQKQIKSTEVEEDSTKEREETQKNMAAIRAQKTKAIVKLANSFKNQVECLVSRNSAIIKQRQLSETLKVIKLRVREAEKRVDGLKKEVALIKTTFDQEKQKAATLKKKASDIAPLDTWREAFLELPHTIEELEESIRTARAKADLNVGVSPQILEEYETKKRQIEELTKQTEEDKENLVQARVQLQQLQDSWLNPLEKMIDALNKSFCSYMKGIKCAGDIALIKSENFEDYGIEIKVQFRDNAPLTTLTAQTQSGGERSVSTMLYLLSLQSLTSCPFRLVDEINQGMDPFNERMIFTQVAQTACKPGLPQYFLITPKLLPDLEFSPQMQILCIFNGPWGCSMRPSR